MISSVVSVGRFGVRGEIELSIVKEADGLGGRPRYAMQLVIHPGMKDGDGKLEPAAAIGLAGALENAAHHVEVLRGDRPR